MIPPALRLIKRSVRSALVAAGLLCATASVAFAHGIDVPPPSIELRASVQPALEGAEPFARTLLNHARNIFSDRDLKLLDGIAENLRIVEQIHSGELHDWPASDADVFRWLAETNLLELVRKSSAVVTLDFRSGLPRHSPDTPIELDQQINLVLLQVLTGQTETNFVVHEMDMTSERDRKPYTVNVSSNGVTFAILKLEQVPT